MGSRQPASPVPGNNGIAAAAPVGPLYSNPTIPTTVNEAPDAGRTVSCSRAPGLESRTTRSRRLRSSAAFPTSPNISASAASPSIRCRCKSQPEQDRLPALRRARHGGVEPEPDHVHAGSHSLGSPVAAAGRSPFSAFLGEVYIGLDAYGAVTGLNFTLNNNRALQAVIGPDISPDVFEGRADDQGQVTSF